MKEQLFLTCNNLHLTIANIPYFLSQDKPNREKISTPLVHHKMTRLGGYKSQTNCIEHDVGCGASTLGTKIMEIYQISAFLRRPQKFAQSS